METIQVQVPSDLAQRLQPYYDQIPQILEWGLQHIKQQQAGLESQQQAITILRQLGATGPDSNAIANYLAASAVAGWSPLEAGGRPASELIIKARGEL
jgi:hypothetical protein